jgi:hypothetical protein
MQNNCEVIASNHFVRWLLLMCCCRVHKESQQSTSSITPGVDELLLGRGQGKKKKSGFKTRKKKKVRKRDRKEENFYFVKITNKTPATKQTAAAA